MSETRDRLKKAAVELFLDRGYARTTIGAIETAAGLAPRAGGFYRHFDSKEHLAAAIAKEEVIEREEEFDFENVFPLGDTRAELLLIARVYLKANERQRKFYPLIQELRNIPEIAEVERSSNEDMSNWLKAWVSEKPYAKAMPDKELTSFALTLFGGLLFYTTKRLQGVSIKNLTDNAFIEYWAEHWAGVLDSRKS